MITINDDLKRFLEPAVSFHCTNRVDVGIFAFEGNGTDFEGTVEAFSYADTVAIAALLNKGYNPRDAAAYVSEHLVAATPHRAGDSSTGYDEHGHQLHVGFFRLADGGIWSVTADMDTSAKPASQIGGDYFAVATRGASIVDENPVDRARHLLTECDARGVVMKPM